MFEFRNAESPVCQAVSPDVPLQAPTSHLQPPGIINTALLTLFLFLPVSGS